MIFLHLDNGNKQCLFLLNRFFDSPVDDHDPLNEKLYTAQCYDYEVL